MKAIIAISDMQVGSYSGLCPKNGLTTYEGGIVKPNKYQKQMLKFWDNFWDVFVPEETADCDDTAVVINGDIVDGFHHNTTYVMTNGIERQEAGALELLRPITNRHPRLYVVRGTEAHVGANAESEERIATTLGAEVNEVGERTSWQWWIDCENVLFQFAHHIETTSSAAYETSAPMRELVTGLVESAQWGRRLPDVFVRSHRHRFTEVSLPIPNSRIRLVVTPAWQLRTPYVERRDRMRMPHIGGVIFKCEDRICTVKEKIYPLPQPKIAKI